MKKRPLTRLFVSALRDPNSISLVDLDQLEKTLAAIVEDARRTWPTLDIPPIWFIPYLAERLPPATDVMQCIQNIQTRDLYIACGVANLVPNAVDLFERHFGNKIKECLSRYENIPDREGRIQQQILDKLLTMDGNGPGTIAQFRGRGSLISWLRVTATHMAIRKRKTKYPQGAKQYGLPKMDSPGAGFMYIRHNLRQQYKRAFQEAMTSLTPRERNLLRQRILDGMTIDDIAAFHSAHRVTASKWLVTLRQKLSETTLEIMADRLNISTDEYEDIMQIIHAQLDFSITRYLTAAQEKRPNPAKLKHTETLKDL